MSAPAAENLDPFEPADRLLPWSKVKDLTGISRTTAWRLQKAGDFPLPVVISPGRVGWRESELRAWRSSRAPRQAQLIPQAPRSFSNQKSPPVAASEAIAAPALSPSSSPAAKAKPEAVETKPSRPPARRQTQNPGVQISFDF